MKYRRKQEKTTTNISERYWQFEHYILLLLSPALGYLVRRVLEEFTLGPEATQGLI